MNDSVRSASRVLDLLELLASASNGFVMTWRMFSLIASLGVSLTAASIFLSLTCSFRAISSRLSFHEARTSSRAPRCPGAIASTKMSPIITATAVAMR